MWNFLNERKRLICILAPTVFGIFYMLIAMLNLQQSVWQGESYGAYLTRYDFGQIWDFAKEANQPPLYFWALKIWAHFCGRTDFAMRFMSVFCGAITLMFAYIWLKYKYGARAAILSTLLLSISPVFVRYGREMQAFTMATMFVFAGTYFLELAINNGARCWRLTYAICIAAGLWTSYFTIFAWLAHFVYLISIYSRRAWQKKQLRAFAVGAALFLPWMPSLCSQLAGRTGSVGGVTLQGLANNWSQILVYQEAGKTSGGALVLLLATSVGLAILGWHYRKRLRMLLSMILVPCLAMILLSLTKAGLALSPQRLLYSAICVPLLGGVAIAMATFRPSRKIKTRLAPAGCAALLLTTAITGDISMHELGSYNFETGREYTTRQLARDLKTMNDIYDEPVIAASADLYLDLSFYDGERQQSFWLSEDVQDYSGKYRALEQAYFGRIDDLDKFLEQHPKLWYVDFAPERGKVKFPREGYRAEQTLSLGASDFNAGYVAVRFVSE